MRRDEPVQVSGTGSGGLSFIQIDGGIAHSVAITANGTAYAWGSSEYGQLGNDVSGTGTRSTTPVPVLDTGPGGIVLTAIAAGNVHSLGLSTIGIAWA
jgi:alpha-tubulin suppressor-like RCC1 family protein